MRGDRLSTLISLAKQKLAAAQVLLSPYVPLLFMGEEYGETAPFPYFVSHTDPDLIEAVRNGRKNEFREFGWQDEPPDPQAEETFRSAVPDPSRVTGDPHKTLWAFHRELIRLRGSHRCLREANRKSIGVHALGERLIIERFSPEDACVLLFNFGDAPGKAAAPFPKGRWTRILDSEEARWRGSGRTAAKELVSSGDAPVEVLLAPQCAVVYHRPVSGPNR